MKKNTNRLIFIGLGIFIILLVIVLKGHFSSLIQTRSTAFPGVEPKDINEVVIENNAKSTTIYKHNGQWVLKLNKVEYVADQQRIDSIIQNILSYKPGDIVSNNKNNHKEFGIDKKRIILKTNDKSYYFYVGNTVDLSGSTYVRIDSQNEIYTAQGFDDIFVAADYRDLHANVVLNEDNVKAIKEQYDNVTINAVKKNDQWFINDKAAIREHMDFFINDLKTLVASDISTKDTASTLTPDLTITVTENNKTTTAYFYKINEDDYMLKKSNSPYIFTVKATYVESLKKTVADLTE